MLAAESSNYDITITNKKAQENSLHVTRKPSTMTPIAALLTKSSNLLEVTKSKNNYSKRSPA